MTKYLYGASVQGIQSYIFETSKLKEMVGASEIVEKICTDFMDEFLKCLNIALPEEYFIRKAAGNVRLVCEESQASEIVKRFPQAVQEVFPGLTISQALVKYEEPLSDEKMDELEKNLNVQRNKPIRPFQIGITAGVRAPRTGRIAYKREDGELLDIATSKKMISASGKEDAPKRLARKFLGDNDFLMLHGTKVRLPFEFSEMTKPGICEWLAIVHADGNNLGKILQSLGKAFQKCPEKVANGYREFSELLDRSTQAAARIAFEKVIISSVQPGDKFFPFRPIVLGGDDLTIVCRGDLAIEFASLFLQNFKRQTKENFKGLSQGYGIDLREGLTACAGIAFMKESYPFHYGYHLAEELCGEAKKASKSVSRDQAPSSLAFHKILSSFHDDYKETKDRELTAKPKDADASIYLNFGPYGIEVDTDLPCIQDLLESVTLLSQKDAPKSGLRRWLSEIHQSKFGADELIKRVSQIAEEKKEFKIDKFNESMKKLKSHLSLENPIVQGKTPIYDMLTLLSWEGDE